MGACLGRKGRPQQACDPSSASELVQHETHLSFTRRGMGAVKKWASLTYRTPWGKPAKLVLANESEYKVSYWVIQEDKLRVKGRREQIERSISAHLTAGNTGGTLSAGVGREEATTTESVQIEHVLVGDCRMGSNGTTQPTEIRFPDKCKELRVYGYFQRENGAWIRYKDKVYTIGRFKNDFFLTAVDSSIEPYA